MQTIFGTDNGNVSLHHRANQNALIRRREGMERGMETQERLKCPLQQVIKYLYNTTTHLYKAERYKM